MKQALLDTNMLSYFLRGEEKVVNKVNDYLQHYSSNSNFQLTDVHFASMENEFTGFQPT